MSAQITLPRVELPGCGYSLEFFVVDPNEIRVVITTDKDDTMSHPERVEVSSELFVRGSKGRRHGVHVVIPGDIVSAVEGRAITRKPTAAIESLTSTSDFVRATYEEALTWAQKEMDRHKEMKDLAKVFESYLKAHPVKLEK